MSREIIVDADTKVGYNFQEKYFYVENKGTRTNRNTKEDILAVLLIVAPSTEVTLEALEDLRTQLEQVTSLSYTWEDTGAFIKTVALNDYDYNPLTIDCPLHKLYIMNTDIVFDLTLNVSPSLMIDDLISYYQLTLGLDVPYTLMQAIYSLLLSYYSPAVYNKISPRENDTSPLYYSKEVCLSNYSNKGSLTYTLKVNPKDETTLDLLGNIVKIDQDKRLITLINAPSLADFPMSEDKKVYISGISTTVGADTYTNDGTYTYVSKDTANKTMTVAENFPISYSFPYPKAYLTLPTTNIVSIDNPTATVVVASVENFDIGDTLTISSATAPENNGDYEIIGINATLNVITLQSVPPKSEANPTAVAYVKQYIGEVLAISSPDKLITFTNPLLVTPEYEQYIIIEGLTSTSLTYQVSTTSTNTITTLTTPEAYTPSYPTLSYNAQANTVSVNITYSTISNLPVGEFYVDDNAQCEAYIGLSDIPAYNPITYLPNVTLEVPNTIGELNGIPTILKGLYTEVYS